MNKIYRYCLDTKSDDPKCIIRNYLQERKIKYSDKYLLVFEISDSAPYFNDVINFMNAKLKDEPQIRCEYSKKELAEAKYLRIYLKRYSGYPQPEAIDVKNSYVNYTFDITNFCTDCGSGLVQNDSFYLKKSFNIEKIRFGGVYWIYDTFFITTELRDWFIKEKFTGIEFIPVKNIRTKQTVDNIVQLKINAIFPEKLEFDTKEVINCKSCNTIKKLKKNDSEIFAPKDILKDLDKDFYLSKEFTGGGLLCCQYVLISNRVYKFFVDNKIKNINAEPIKFI
ncbi:MAG TPA: hypothetical protein DCZ76_09810 [Treponema sp.]|nr:hypothetical protein [Treponema sp.]